MHGWRQNGVRLGAEPALKNAPAAALRFGSRPNFVRYETKAHGHAARRNGFGPGLGLALFECGPLFRLLLWNQERIQGPENGSIARFYGLGRYQSRSEIGRRFPGHGCKSSACVFETSDLYFSDSDFDFNPSKIFHDSCSPTKYPLASN